MTAGWSLRAHRGRRSLALSLQSSFVSAHGRYQGQTDTLGWRCATSQKPRMTALKFTPSADVLAPKEPWIVATGRAPRNPWIHVSEEQPGGRLKTDDDIVLVLDTDHLAELDRGSAVGAAILEKLDRSTDPVATTIVSVEEQLRGWLAQINRIRNPHNQIDAYARLQRRFAFFADWHLLPFDEAAASLFINFRRNGIRIGSMDLKIACIVIAHDARLLTRNLVDFRKVPNLVAENWL